MSTRDKKYDDEHETPSSWITKHAPGSRTGGVPRPSPPKIRQKSHDGKMTTPAKYERSYYQSSKQEKGRKYDEEDDGSCAEFCDMESTRKCPTIASRLPQSKPFRRITYILLMILGLGWFCYRQAIAPLADQDWPIKEAFLKSFRGTYGFGAGGDFETEGYRIATLDSSLVPGGASDLNGKRRLIFVGDIHGCKHELSKLLQSCSFDAKLDHLIDTGDVISKGPDSPGTLDELIRLNATSVRGNHEDRILTLAGVTSDESINQSKDVTAQANKDVALLKSLTKEHIAYLKDMPLILRIPPLPLTKTLSKKEKRESLSSEVLVVHAGLVPAVPLHKQDQYYVMNMRSLGRRTHVPSILPADKAENTLPWSELWNWYHSRLDKGEMLRGWHRSEMGLQDVILSEQSWIVSTWEYFRTKAWSGRRRPFPQTVIYGHDSKAGLTMERWSKGLDTGCVKGGELTAMVLDARGHTEMFSVKCKDHRA